MNAPAKSANAAVALYEQARAEWKPRLPWVEIQNGREVHCGEAWLDISHDLLARWAGDAEYDSWSLAIGQNSPT